MVARDSAKAKHKMESPARLVRVEVQDINDNQPVFVDHQQVDGGRDGLGCMNDHFVNEFSHGEKKNQVG